MLPKFNYVTLTEFHYVNESTSCNINRIMLHHMNSYQNSVTLMELYYWNSITLMGLC